MKFLHKPKIIIISLVLIVVSFFIIYRLISDQEDPLNRDFSREEEEVLEVLQEKNEILPDENKQEPKIYVDVKGAVKYEGVYEAVDGMRIIDIIELAGGFVENADKKRVNLALLLKDEMVIYIPAIGEKSEELANVSFHTQKEQSKVSINTGNAAELENIPGIGPSKAEAIISYREENGAFKKIEDLLNVSGIGEKSLEKMKEWITVH